MLATSTAMRAQLPARLRYWSYFLDAEVSNTRSISTADVLSSVDQLGQFLSGIEHTCFYSRGWHVENLRYFVDRLLVEPRAFARMRCYGVSMLCFYGGSTSLDSERAEAKRVSERRSEKTHCAQAC